MFVSMFFLFQGFFNFYGNLVFKGLACFFFNIFFEVSLQAVANDAGLGRSQ